MSASPAVASAGRGLTHRQAVWVMLLATLLWSMAGVVTRQLDSARSFEVTFWRSLFNALTLLVLLGCLRGPVLLARALRRGGPLLWLSGLCWAVMYTSFMVALTMTTVANVLVTMALGPVISALLARGFLGQRLPLRTWVAIAVAGLGIGWMYGAELSHATPTTLWGVLIALGVPCGGAVNWALIQRSRQRDQSANDGSSTDMLPAVLLGATLSALAMLPLAWPFSASHTDLAWLALLGSCQLAIPCLLVVTVARVLSAPEVALLALLEVIFGVLWAWWGAGEQPSASVLWGGAVVLGSLALHEVLALRQRAPSEAG